LQCPQLIDCQRISWCAACIENFEEVSITQKETFDAIENALLTRNACSVVISFRSYQEQLTRINTEIVEYIASGSADVPLIGGEGTTAPTQAILTSGRCDGRVAEGDHGTTRAQ
jgi:hypothetical protein